MGGMLAARWRPTLVGLVIAAALSAFTLTPVRAQSSEPSPAPVTTVVVFGDSQGEGIVVGLRHLLQGNKAFKLLNRTKAGSSISQSHEYDWPAVIDEFAQRDKADIAVMVFGGNDRLPIHPANARPIQFHSDAWKQIYEERVSAMVASLVKAHVYVIWCGDPIAREPTYSHDMEYLNSLYQEVVRSEGAEYFPLWTVVSDGQGGYASHGKALDGQTRRLRGDDGIHFTTAGYDVVARSILDAIDAHLAKLGAPPQQHAER